MASPASIAKHPIHPMLVTLPIGLWVFSLVSDVIYVMKWGGSVWNDVAFYTMAGGIAGALIAALPGFVDLLSMSSGKVKSIGFSTARTSPSRRARRGTATFVIRFMRSKENPPVSSSPALPRVKNPQWE